MLEQDERTVCRVQKTNTRESQSGQLSSIYGLLTAFIQLAEFAFSFISYLANVLAPFGLYINLKLVKCLQSRQQLSRCNSGKNRNLVQYNHILCNKINELIFNCTKESRTTSNQKARYDIWPKGNRSDWLILYFSNRAIPRMF